LGGDESTVRPRNMLGEGRADQRLIVRRHRSVVSVRIDRFVAVVMLGDLDPGLEVPARWNAVVHAMAAFDDEHRDASGRKQRRIGSGAAITSWGKSWSRALLSVPLTNAPSGGPISAMPVTCKSSRPAALSSSRQRP